ncbi:LuxR family transcriptional regulator [Kitasatospora sp. LaBMicrA B282]|uniref:LuxR family transcriptional regulator n=1 Tax=Kitasatospora sp. LaBMicrA B282 TaxID=3420949 RepID=UPI003D09F40E
MNAKLDNPSPSSISEAARAAYTALLADPWSTARMSPEVTAELLTWGLVTEQPADDGAEGRLLPVDPAIVARRMTSNWRSQAAALEWQASLLEERLAPLALTYRQAPEHGESGGQFERLHGHEAINSFIKESAAAAQHEILTAQPGGARSSAALEASLPHTLATVRRGVSMRTLYQSTARCNEPTRRYVRAVVAAGGQVRTVEDYFERLLVFDRSTALIPGDASRSTALVVTQPEVCAYLADSFDRQWDRASDFIPSHPVKAAAEVVPGVREQIKDLLLAGYTGEVIARRVGLKHRAYQDHIGALKQELGATTLVQLGYAIALERGRTLAVPGPSPEPGPSQVPGPSQEPEPSQAPEPKPALEPRPAPEPADPASPAAALTP